MQDNNRYFSESHKNFFERRIVSEIFNSCLLFHLKVNGKFIRNLFTKKVFDMAEWISEDLLLCMEITTKNYNFIKPKDVVSKHRKLVLLNAKNFSLYTLEKTFTGSIGEFKLEGSKLIYTRIIGREETIQETIINIPIEISGLKIFRDS
ncbi:MAG: hypothetical protein SFU25_08590 [Candidatus Caenarcaniphilales bacterium]|nr:hypothetical protein [Candidatus Caenarcaniphilales bacterium]